MTKERVFRSIESHEHDEIIHGSCRTLEPESPPSSGEVIRFPATNSTKTRRSMKKRVVSIPIKGGSEGSRAKGEGSAPPSDSWAWRKYGQKPIKGSPYPRAYYRCSSSKGCPAKKQVERNRDDPTMLLITYSSEHNHLRAAARNINHHNNHQHSPSQSDVSTPATVTSSEPEPESAPTAEIKIETPPLLLPPSLDEFGWFSDMQTTSSMLMDSPFFAESGCNNKRATRDAADVAMFFPVGGEGEEDDSLFADLGELPEFSIVF